MRDRIRQLHEANPMLGTRGCRLGLQFPEIYEMQVRAIVRAARAVADRTGEAPLVEIMHPLVGFAEELARLRELTERRRRGGADASSTSCGTMIELPRAALRADEIAAEADFFSFGTNDLTQTTLGFSRDDAEGKFLTYYLEHGILERNPFEVLDEDGVGDLMRIAVERGRRDEARRSRSGSAASTAASRARSPSATGSGSTTCPARRTASRSRGSPQRRRRSPKRASPRSRSAASRPTEQRGRRSGCPQRPSTGSRARASA